ncbi:MAG: hypothetical protein Q4G26_06285, partial [Paracoccus sp. (in: a-proteobacteria)]|nr:hypothetical protein [Paracoccus sp. (in: a-proteobacteria)]
LAAMPAPARLIAEKRSICAAHWPEARQDGHSFDPIPASAIPHDVAACRERNKIERAFCCLRDWRRIATCSAVAIIGWCD